MSSLNHVILMGGLTRDPELRSTTGSIAITKLSLAISEQYKNKNHRDTEIVAWKGVPIVN